MKNRRLNRSLSSVKSPAPCFRPLRARHTPAYDFTCRHCGEVLEFEREAFKLLDTAMQAFDVDSGKPFPVRNVFDEADAVRSCAEQESRVSTQEAS